MVRGARIFWCLCCGVSVRVMRLCACGNRDTGAGALLDRIAQPNDWLDDPARLAVDHWRFAADQIEHSSKSLFDFFTESEGGRNLLTHHFDHFVEDVRFCSQIDLIDQVPELNLSEWTIRFIEKPTG